MMRPIPKKWTILGGTFDIITDPKQVQKTLDEDEYAVINHVLQKTFLRQTCKGYPVTCRTLWQWLIHESLEQAKKELRLRVSHDTLERLESFIADMLERNGFLER